MSELVQKLAKGDHRVIFRKIQDDGVQELKECIDRDYVHIKFTETKGGTELGFPLDRDRSDLSGADWDKKSGKIHLEGELTLDYVKVRLVADVDLSNLEGQGHLDILEEEKEENQEEAAS
jgi:hypothetical protein